MIAARKGSVFCADPAVPATVDIRMREYQRRRKGRKASTLIVSAPRMKCPCGGYAVVCVFPLGATTMTCSHCATPNRPVRGLSYARLKRTMDPTAGKRTRDDDDTDDSDDEEEDGEAPHEEPAVSCRDATDADMAAYCLSPAQLDDVVRAIDTALKSGETDLFRLFDLLVDAVVDTHETLCLRAEQAVRLRDRYATPCIREALSSRVLDVWALHDASVGPIERRHFLYGGFVPAMTLAEWVDHRTCAVTRCSSRGDFTEL